MGGPIPRDYYLTNNPPVPKEGMESISIIAGVGGFKKLKFKVLVANSLLRYFLLNIYVLRSFNFCSLKIVFKLAGSLWAKVETLLTVFTTNLHRTKPMLIWFLSIASILIWIWKLVNWLAITLENVIGSKLQIFHDFIMVLNFNFAFLQMCLYLITHLVTCKLRRFTTILKSKHQQIWKKLFHQFVEKFNNCIISDDFDHPKK